MNTNKGILGILLIATILTVSTGMATALQDPYPMDGYVVYKSGSPVDNANITFTNLNTCEIIYKNSLSVGYYGQDAGNFASGYTDGDVIQYYTVLGDYSNTTIITIDVTTGYNFMNITVDAPPTTPSGSSIAGTTKYVGDSLEVTGAGSTDADSDPVTYQYEFRQTSASGTVVQALSSTNTYTLQTTDAHTTIYVNVYGRADNVNSVTYESINRIVTNSIPVLTSIGAKNVDDMVQITVDEDATDGDSDTQTYSCNRTDLFTDFSTSTGLGHFTPFYNQTGVYYVDFGVSDGYGGTDNETITITVSDVTFDTSLLTGWTIFGWTDISNKNATQVADLIGINCEYLTTRNATTGEYTTYNPSTGHYEFDIQRGWGYYGKTTSDTLWTRSTDTNAYDLTLIAGWNIVGSTDLVTRDANYVAASVGGNCQYVTGRNATTGAYVNFNPSVGHYNFDITSGSGYYVKVSGETLWERTE